MGYVLIWFMLGIIGVVLGALRGHKKAGTAFFLGLLLGPVLLLGDCGGDDGGAGAIDPPAASSDEPSGDAITTTDALAAALVAAGIPCDGLEQGELESDATFGPESRSGTATCQSTNGQLDLDVFEDQDHFEQYLRQGETVGCAFMEGFGISKVNYARGQWWSISPEDSLDGDSAEAIADALGGEAQVLDCT